MTTLTTSPVPARTGDRPHRLTDADIVIAAGGTVLHGNRTRDIDLPAVAVAGPRAICRAARQALAGRPGAVAAGLIPFDPALAPRLAVIEHPVRDPFASAPTEAGVAVSAADGPVDREYLAAVDAALGRIDAGALVKVVMARSVDVPLARLDVEAVWARLAAANSAGWTFCVRDGARYFVGASPELVAAVHGGVVRTHPLAGSLPRSGDLENDAAREARLLASVKDLHEHGLVVDHIVEAVVPLVEHIDVPATPVVLRTDAMLHLGTPMVGRARPGVGSLEVALTMHPTPAVGGVPTATALEAIRELEPHPRDAYAGLVGWTDEAGNGEWALALRCAHLDEGRARLYAGAGVVRGSTPEAEHRETAAKLQTVRRALAADVSSPRIAQENA